MLQIQIVKPLGLCFPFFDFAGVAAMGWFGDMGNITVNGVFTPATVLVGDVNCDGVVNLLDVEPFVELISTGEFSDKADINTDGIVNLLDVGPFIELLSGG